jgi:hypothetical protein
MGNDGGSIPGRQDLVKEKEKEKRVQNNDLIKQSQSKYCALSKDPLRKPIVGDKLGLLYNKESLIKALIEKRLPKNYHHISCLKDIKDLNITLSKKNDENEESKIVCPITMMEFSGMNNFYIVWKCGCVVSKKALDELNMKIKNKCVHCGASAEFKCDLVSLNYTSKERESLFNKIMEDKKKINEKKIREKEREKTTENKEEVKIKNKSSEIKQHMKKNELIIQNKDTIINEILNKKRENEKNSNLEENNKEKDDDFFDINSNKKSRIE